jgi:hypothetical protein
MAYKNKKDQAIAAAKHYAANKEKMKVRAASAKKRAIYRNQRIVLEYLASHPCVCGENDPLMLEFDHVRGQKEQSISNMVRNGVGIIVLNNEIAKCEVSCVKCHRIKTANEQGWYKISPWILPGQIHLK